MRCPFFSAHCKMAHHCRMAVGDALPDSVSLWNQKRHRLANCCDFFRQDHDTRFPAPTTL
ncbi:hypothetical protein A9320_15805 [Ruegeria sp. PBVC088]|nr:hypothetical protein A9320_15805 [Ruegeria sp. PBVC088]